MSDFDQINVVIRDFIRHHNIIGNIKAVRSAILPAPGLAEAKRFCEGGHLSIAKKDFETLAEAIRPYSQTLGLADGEIWIKPKSPEIVAAARIIDALKGKLVKLQESHRNLQKDFASNYLIQCRLRTDYINLYDDVLSAVKKENYLVVGNVLHYYEARYKEIQVNLVNS